MTANRNALNDLRSTIWAATTAVRPAAGPLTLECDPLSAPTTIPPTMPATKPEISGAPEASATPRHNGSATRKTTSPAVISRGKVAGENGFAFGMVTAKN
jgi:hypothetical protein